MPKQARKAVKLAPVSKITFEFLNETPGAVRYQEVGDNGQPLVSDADGAVIGGLYFRKQQFARVSADYASTGKPCKRITITVEAHDA